MAVKRPARICFNLAAILSLILCLALIGLWWRGRTHTLDLQRTTSLSHYNLAVSRGELYIKRYNLLDPLYPYGERWLGWTYSVYSHTELVEDQALFPNTNPHFFPAPQPGPAGFFLGRSKGNGFETTEIRAPMWFVTSLFTILPLAAILRLARRRRRRARRLATGHCIT